MSSAGRELQFIADASAVLSSSLDYEQTLRQVARLAVPEIADWCGLYLVGEDGTESEITSGHADAELDAFLSDVRRRRREQDGASESRRVAESGEAVLGTDVRDNVPEELDEDERRLAARLGAKSYMIVPLVARGRSIGSLTLLSTREGRHYTESDLAFAQSLAARCALAIDNARLHDAAERSLTLLDTVFATAPVGLAFVDRDMAVVRVNDTMAGFTGRSVDELTGRTLTDALGDQAGEMVALLREVLATGEPALDREVSGPAPADPGDPRHWHVSCTAVHGPDGDVLGVSTAVIDVTERRRLLEAEREARIRADFLARAGALLDESLDYERTLRAVAEIAIPEVADWCGVSILDEAGSLQQVAAAHVDPEQRRIGEELNRRFPPADRTGGAGNVARTGQTHFVREVTGEMIAAAISDPEQLDLVQRLGLRSVIIAPLRARGRMFGTLTLANAESGRLFDEADVQLAEELARRAGIAIDNARLYTERTRIAHTLQAKLLPERLPDIPGALVAARYRAAGELNEVGGDFYDVFPRSEDEWAMVVGDVSGKGAEAAAITALARYTLRAGALDDERPANALRRLNAAMLAHDDTSQFATAVLAYVSIAGGDRLRVRLSLAGHPPAVVVRRDGAVDTVGAYGTMLGLRPDAACHDTELELARGDALLLYTDGVTEAGARDAPFGEQGLVALAASLAGREPQEIVDAVEQAVVGAQEGQPRDDVALLAIALRVS